MAEQDTKQKKSTSSPKDAKRSSINYDGLDQLDGKHSWMDQVPEGSISYKVRTLTGGKVTYFNFNLAKEMGLIPKDHPHKLYKKLEEKLLETFNLRIINEYDIENNKRFKKETIKDNEFMATRYLQLQHKNKQGKTSGDGRGIWNGTVSYKGEVWDVSSRGTGVTKLAPGAVEADKNLESGNFEYGYGCGLAEIDELYSSAIMSESFHLNGINTERVLVIIDNGKQLGVGVRAGKNLFRPAHIFNFLKQSDYESLNTAVDYLIDRQFKNKEWDFDNSHKNKYKKLLDQITFSFAQFASRLERDYIFAWLDWDGDNVLLNAGIIDYGSIRQLGIRHDNYRYDDTDRYSTNLNEQKSKAKLIVQVFIQLLDYLETKDKKPLKDFKDHPKLKNFDNFFQYSLLDRFLFQMGYNEEQSKYLLLKHRGVVQSLYDSFVWFEGQKTEQQISETDDGVNRPAKYNLRSALREMTKIININKHEIEPTFFSPSEFLQIVTLENHQPDESYLTNEFVEELDKLQKKYVHCFQKASGVKIKQKLSVAKRELKKRAGIINKKERLTGNALIFIVVEMLKKQRTLGKDNLQIIIDDLIASQITDPNFVKYSRKYQSKSNNKASSSFLKSLFSIVEDYSEDI